MASSKRNLNEFRSYEGKINIVSNMYEFPPLFSLDSEKRLRRWSIMSRLVKPNNKASYGQNWNILTDSQLPLHDSYLDVGVKLPSCECQFWIEQGIVGGQNSRYPPTYTEEKNVGKKNARNVFQQSLLMMRSKYLKRLEEGALTNADDLGKNIKDDANTYYWPMLATKFKEEFAELKYPAYAQIKMNGIRMLSYIASNVITHSRDLKEIPGIPQIKSELLIPLRDLYDEDSSISVRIDGELFGFNTPLNEISGWSRNPTINGVSKVGDDTIHYFIFDMFNPGEPEHFEKRLANLNDMRSTLSEPMVKRFPINIEYAKKHALIEFNKVYKLYESQIGSIETHASRSEEQEFLKDEYAFVSFDEWRSCIESIDTEHKSFDFEICGNLAFVPTLLVHSKAELLCLYFAALEHKFEGLMARNAQGLYATSNESKTSKNRSKDLQKLKPWYDEEFEIVNYTSGKGRNQNAIIWICKTANGNEFNCDPKNMTIDKRKELYEHFKKSSHAFEDEYKGLMMTVQYEEKNKDSGIPQRAKALGVRNFG